MDDKTEVVMVQEIGTYERHFNQIQSSYRAIASGWVGAAFGGIGYLLTHAEESFLPIPMPALIGGICLVVCIGVMLIWILDLKIYHRLLQACFAAGRALEAGRPYLSDIRRRMDENRVSVSRGLNWFYYGALTIMVIIGVGSQYVLPYPSSSSSPLNVYQCVILCGFLGIKLLMLILLRGQPEERAQRDACACGHGAPASSTVANGGRICMFDELLEWQRKLVDAAHKVSMNAYNPYSGVAVGAAVLSDVGGPSSEPAVFTGANFENVSFSLTLCAERAAVAKAVSEGVREFRAIAVIAHGGKIECDEFLAPCGACRQVLFEFVDQGQRDFEVILSSPDKSRALVTSVKALLPHAMPRRFVEFAGNGAHSRSESVRVR